MTRDELAARLLHTFLEELDEQVRVLNAELLALEREGASAQRLGAVFRVAHTLKGAARATRLTPIEELCHAMEGPLAGAQSGARGLREEDFQLLFEAADALSSAGERLRRSEPLDSAALRTLARRFSASSGRYGSAHLTTPGFGGAPVRDSRQRPATAKTGAGAGRSGSQPRDRSNAGDGFGDSDESDTSAESGTLVADRDRESEGEGEHGTGDPLVLRQETQVRVRAEKLDDLLAAAGEVMLAGGAAATLPAPAAELAQRAHRIAGRARRAVGRLRKVLDESGATEADRRLLTELAEEATALAGLAQQGAMSSTRSSGMSARATDELMESVRRLRLRPFEEAVEALPRVVRDLASETGKQVDLRVIGGAVEADRSVLDGLREALLHLVRNAVDHGIETKEQRLRAGKPANGTVTVGASLQGQRLRVVVRDDGSGLDLAAAAEAARRHGRQVPDDQQALVRLLFESGVSTRESTTEISGRGVGLDIVRTATQRLRGTVQVDSRPGEGTAFIIETPLTLATQRALLVEVSGQILAVPTSGIDELRLFDAAALREVEGRTLLSLPSGAVPVASMASVLGPPLVAPEADGRLATVIVSYESRRLALTVDRLLEETELVVRPIDNAGGAASPAIAGAALLPTGRIALVLSAFGLLERASGVEDRIRVRATKHAPARRVLVVDDSITTRTLEQSVLQAAGFEVLTAVDGQSAWEMLQQHGADLVLSDVEMPRMDGYELCEAIRASARFASTPVVLVTSLESPEQRQRGLEAGADAYVVKSSFDQDDLLDTVRQLLGRGASA